MVITVTNTVQFTAVLMQPDMLSSSSSSSSSGSWGGGPTGGYPNVGFNAGMVSFWFQDQHNFPAHQGLLGVFIWNMI